MKDWFYNEFNHVGIDYSQKNTAIIYDAQMESFRDYANEAEQFIEKLNVDTPEELSAVDIGCGTGAFAVHAAKYLKKVHAVDVSEEMLNIARSKAKSLKIYNIEFHHSGFLQFQADEEVDVVFSKWAFHHLPDYWKQAALFNINKMLKIGGLFLLTDIVFKFDLEFENNTDNLLCKLSEKFDRSFIEETKTHIREEYSTFDWILHGLIERAGFTIERMDASDFLASEYFCRKSRHVKSSANQ